MKRFEVYDCNNEVIASLHPLEMHTNATKKSVRSSSMTQRRSVYAKALHPNKHQMLWK